MIVDLINNTALLITLSAFIGIFSGIRGKSHLLYQIFLGVWYGCIAVTVMMVPFEYKTGAIFDSRSIVLSMAGLFGGGIPALIATVFSGAYRIYLGGSGIWAGLFTILISASIGFWFRRIFQGKSESINLIYLLGIGILIHIGMLLCQLLFPWPIGLSIIKIIWMPVLLVFPVAFVIVGWLLRNEEKRYSSLRAIIEANNLFRATLYSIGDAVITTDIKGKILQMNHQAEKLTGWTEQDAHGKPFEVVFRVINEISGNVVDSPAQMVLQTGSIATMDKHIMLISKDGQKIPIADSGAPITGANGKIIGVVVVFRDQSEERYRVKQIEESEELFRNLFENHTAIHLLLDPKSGRIINANPSAVNFYGYTIEELKSMTMGQINILPPEEYKDKLQLAREKQQVLFEFQHRLANGSIKDVAVHSSLVELSNKKYLYSIVHDITERKELFNQLVRAKELSEENERRLRISEERLRFSLEGANDGIWDVNMETNEVYISPRGCEILGYKPDEMLLIAKVWNDLVYPEDLPETHKKLEKYLNGYTSMFHMEQRLITKNGSPKWILTRGKVTETTPEGKPKRMTGTHTDISKQKTQEFQLMETQFKLKQQNEEYMGLNEELHEINEQLMVARNKAEESDRLKSVFLQNMSHEIRTPLNGILGFTSLLAANKDLPHSKRESYSAIINRSADSLMQIINDILDLSRLETDQFSLNKKSFQLNSTLKDLFIMYKKKLEDKGKQHIQLNVTIPPRSIVMYNDEHRLSQILTNLLDNAVKFTHEGQILFGVKAIVPGKISLTVTDTGIGIASEKHSIIFERFAQADAKTSINYGGTGLGLSIVKKLVSIMGGKITIESEPGSGTSFTLEFPYDEGSLMEVERIERFEETGELKPMEVLLVEDDEPSIVYYTEIFKKEKVNLHVAENGRDALRMFRELRPKAVLIDIRLPDMNGLDVVREIRKSDRKVKIIAQSAFAMSVDEVNALEAGCNLYLSKPVSPSVLINSLYIK